MYNRGQGRRSRVSPLPFIESAEVHIAIARIQAPGKGHIVYTPLATVTKGGHLYNYGSLHHSEFNRSFEKITRRLATNHDHFGVPLMLIHMAAALPLRVKEGRGNRLTLLWTHPD